jgi:opacity protein-like surface antigen
MMKRGVLTLLVLGVLATSPMAYAQNYGDGFGLGGVLLPSGSATILGMTRIGDDIGLEIGVGIDLYDNDDHSSSDFSVSGAIKKFWSTESTLQPYGGARFGLHHSSYDYGDGSHDDTLFGFSAFIGGEYFVTKRVSLDGEVGVGMYFGSVQVRTGSRLAAFLYL